MGFKYTKVRAYADIEGLGVMDISRFSVTYALNQIPTMTAIVPAGSPVSGGGGITSKASKLVHRHAIAIKLSASGPVPGAKGNMTVFKGYSNSVSLSASPGAYGIQLGGVGWLDDLRATSAFSDQRSPAAAYDMQASLTTLSRSGADYGRNVMEGVVAALADSMGSGSIDVFTALKQLTTDIAKGKIKFSLYNNQTALAALDKISGELKFKFGTTASVQLGVSEALSHACLSLYNGGTIWDAWTKLCNDMLFMIVPTAERAWVVPYDPQLDTPNVVIGPDQYVYITNVALNRKAVAGVLLLDHRAFQSTCDIVSRQPLNIAVAGEKHGMLDAIPMPVWLNGPVYQTATQLTYDLLVGIRGRASDRETIAGLTPANAPFKSANTKWNEDRDKLRDVGQSYARWWMANSVFGENSMNIVGPLRLDVCPGMMVAVTGLADSRAGASGASTVFGIIQAVTIEVNSDSASASTSILVSHTRGKSDNVRFGSPDSALYATSFGGGPLVSSTDFGNDLGGGAIDLGGSINLGSGIDLGGAGGGKLAGTVVAEL